MNAVYFGSALSLWLRALVFFAGGIIAALLFFWISGIVLRRFCSRTKRRIDDIMLSKARLPLGIFLAVLGLIFAVNCLTLPTEIDIWTDRIGGCLCIICIAWAVGRVVDALLVHYAPEKAHAGDSNIELRKLLRGIFHFIIWVIPIVLIIHTLGYNVTAILAGLGIGGAAIALASQNTLANFFGSIVVFIDKPFRPHDCIRIAGFEGEVIDMGLRCTRLRNKDGSIITVPNSMFTSNCVINMSKAEPQLTKSL
jgi:MscS family membrane protein